eukprot:scaffold2874_cov110-Alexandrium_tamarense.AAC.46
MALDVDGEEAKGESKKEEDEASRGKQGVGSVLADSFDFTSGVARKRIPSCVTCQLGPMPRHHVPIKITPATCSPPSRARAASASRCLVFASPMSMHWQSKQTNTEHIIIIACSCLLRSSVAECHSSLS